MAHSGTGSTCLPVFSLLRFILLQLLHPLCCPSPLGSLCFLPALTPRQSFSKSRFLNRQHFPFWVSCLPRFMSVLVCSAVIRCHQLCGSNSRHVFSHNSVDCTSKTKVSTGLVSSENSFLVLQVVPPHCLPSLCHCPCLLLKGHWPYWIRTHPDDPILT